ncbi:hypothetical protein [Aliidiomarina haloalkalitolerans]|uniref:Lipoprotein SmpA/OmlA domain-containing protein n=1 Tax=Aliidiomarina haloalkalitolerans TaxID=859059 RepID=A0A432VY31_9GAMM|nr:hypothetical protein [Aliidiomarina haloalkalitolerans]MCL4409828.1 hypothetical protein [Gammaproteobacteria bacterium]RUO21601.1 hypothetical protein CWE06_01730 [Aliidiomarina haloalkalitolerans]
MKQLTILAIFAVLLLSACASTDNTPGGQSQSSQRVMPLAEITYDNVERVLQIDQTQIQDIQRWWGTPSSQGQTGDALWYNYTYVGQTGASDGSTRMLSLTLYFNSRALLQDYDIQIHEFPAYSRP